MYFRVAPGDRVNCLNCGHKIPHGDAFCVYCGAIVRSLPASLIRGSSSLFWSGLSLFAVGMSGLLTFTHMWRTFWHKSTPQHLEGAIALFAAVLVVGLLLVALSRRAHRWCFWPGLLLFAQGLVMVPLLSYTYVREGSPGLGELAIPIGLWPLPCIVIGALFVWWGWPRDGVKHPRAELSGFLVVMSLLSMISVIPATTAPSHSRADLVAAPYKIGALFAVTGGNAPLGEPEKQTAEMMEEEINANGGINGHAVDVIICDYESDATKCATFADRLIYKDKVVAIIGPTGTGDTLQIVNLAQAAQIPLISCGAGISIVTPTETNDKRWVFTTPQLSVTVVQKLCDYLLTKGISKIALLTDTAGFGKDGRTNLKTQAAPDKYNITITEDQTYGATDADMMTQLTLIKNSGPQAVVCWGTSPGPAIVARNMATLGMTDIPLFCSNGIDLSSFVTTAGSSANGVIFPCGKLPIVDYLSDSDPQKALLLEYRDSFNARYGNGTANTFGGHACDSLSMVVTALKNAVEETPAMIYSSDVTLQVVRAKVRDYIENMRGFVGVGGIFNMSATDHNGLDKTSLEMVGISNGSCIRLS